MASTVFVLLARDPGCGVEEPEKGINAPCTRDRDCEKKLLCEKGVCVDRNANADAGDGGEVKDSGAGDADDDG